MTDEKTTNKAQTGKVGDVVKVGKDAHVVRPDNTELRVIRGAFILDEPGTFIIDGQPVKVS